MEENPFRHTPAAPKSEDGTPKWESHKPPVLGREHFELELAFAKELSQKYDVPLIFVIENRTNLLRRMAFDFDTKDHLKLIGLKPGVTDDTILDITYAEYLEKEKYHTPTPYHQEGTTRYGCFEYNTSEDEKALRIHFQNAEFDEVGPLDKSKLAERQREMRDVVTDMRARYPDMQEVRGLSWLYNVPAYTRLFPESYLANLEIEDDPVHWRRGTTIWGQFRDNQNRLKQDMADELLRRVRALDPGERLMNVFKAGPPLLPPLKTHGPIADFCKMYDVS